MSIEKSKESIRQLYIGKMDDYIRTKVPNFSAVAFKQASDLV
jgi:hypothetical protein